MAGNVPEPEQKALANRLRKRLRRFASLLSLLASADDPKAVHNARVWSRRLQQYLAVLFPKPRPRKARKLRRKLRRIKRALGEWRNCDVMLALVAREQRHTRSHITRRAWEAVREHLSARRAREITRARRKLVKYSPEDFAAPTLKPLERPAEGQGEGALMQPLRASVQEASVQWHSALKQADESRDETAIHAFRIATKRLRYLVELLYDLRDETNKPLLGDLKKWQTRLGVWHDRQMLQQAIAEALARAEFLLREPDTARALLGLLKKIRARQSAELDGIFRLPRVEIRSFDDL
jgi:CHAD domain-containing protein